MPEDSCVTATASASHAVPKLCGNCGKNPQAKGHRWCAACKNEADREYRAERDAGIEERGFVRGCEAMRLAILTGLNKGNPVGLVYLREVSVFVRETLSPIFRTRT